MIKPKRVENIDIHLLEEFPLHPFSVLYNDDMATLVESIFSNGITSPILVWEKNAGEFIILSGHRRKFACQIINQMIEDGKISKEKAISELPALIYKDLSEDEATVIMVDENAKREKLLPSEKARAYKMKLEALKRQGKRTDLSFVESGENSHGKETAEIIGEATGESVNQIRRYIRLTYLIPELLELVDKEALGFRCAVELSFLKKEEQHIVYEKIYRSETFPSLKQAQQIKGVSIDKTFTPQIIDDILCSTRMDDRVSFRLTHEQLSHLKMLSTGTDINRSEILRTMATTGGPIYIGRETIGELREMQADVARVGNLMKMQQNRLDTIANNPFLVNSDKAAIYEALEETKALRSELDSLRRKMYGICEAINKKVSQLNSPK